MIRGWLIDDLSHFLRPILRGGELSPNGSHDDVHLRLIEKRVVDFLLVLRELFSLGATTEALWVNIDWKSAISLQRGPVGSKCQVEGVALHQPFFFWENYANDLL